MTYSCFHCEEPVPKSEPSTLLWEGSTRHFCCAGCFAVSEAIINNGLDDYYRFRTEVSEKVEELVPDVLKEIELLDDPTIQQQFVEQHQTLSKAELGVEGITCAACGWLIETRLQTLPGVHQVTVNPMTHRLTIQWDNNTIVLSRLVQAVTKLGFHAYPFKQSLREQFIRKENRQFLIRLGIAGLGMMQVMMFAIGGYIGDAGDIDAAHQSFLHWVSGIVATPIVLYSAMPFFRNAWIGLRNKHLVMDLPVAIAIALAYSSSVWATINETGQVYFDSVSMFVFFLLIGRYLEHRVRTQAVIQSQTRKNTLPLSVTRINESGAEIQTPLHHIQPGDYILVKAGETVPVDGEIIKGQTELNESLINGESTPIQRGVGDKVLAGSMNQSQPITLITRACGNDTYLSAIQAMSEKAHQDKPAYTQLADSIAQWFVLSLFIIVLSVFSVWWQIDPNKAFWIALSVLVVSCPCALSLATPAALTRGMQSIAQRGLLILSPNTLNQLNTIDTIVFDKTGTLTLGNLSFIEMELFDSRYNEHELLAISAALEKEQTHPIARALTPYRNDSVVAEKVFFSSGEGVEGFVNDQYFKIGKQDYCLTENACDLLSKNSFNKNSLNKVSVNSDNVSQRESLVTTEKHTNEPLPEPAHFIAVYVSSGSQLIAKLYFSDQLKEDAIATVNALSQEVQKVLLLSGDSTHTVQSIAAECGIEHFAAEKKPEEKAEIVKSHQQSGHQVMMVGDGINDSIVLSQSNIGIAVDTAVDLSRSNADAILTGHQLFSLVDAIKTAKATHSIIKQNLTWALGYNIVAIPFAAMGYIPPWLAAIGMTASSLVVVLNAMRIK